MDRCQALRLRSATFKDKPRTISALDGRKLRRQNGFRFLPLAIDLKFADAAWFDAIDRLATPSSLERMRLNTEVTTVD